MAKAGLDYFPLDVTMDQKVELIEAEFGLTGFGVVVHLLQEIYGKAGYYIEWTNEVALLFARKIGLGGSAVSEIVEASIRRGMFDKELYDKYQVLTSKGIQKRYFEAVSRRKQLEVDFNILLVDYTLFLKSVDIKRVNVNILSKNADIFKQSKVEKSRVKESKVEESIDTVSKETVCRTKDVRRVIEAWNSLGLQTIKQILPNTDRGKMLRKRINDYGIDDVLSAIEKVRASSFLMGDNRNGWQATFDWFIRPNNFPKVLSGNYDNNMEKPRTSNVFFDLLESGELNDNC